jgi:hypothetical protein
MTINWTCRYIPSLLISKSILSRCFGGLNATISSPTLPTDQKAYGYDDNGDTDCDLGEIVVVLFGKDGVFGVASADWWTWWEERHG